MDTDTFTQPAKDEVSTIIESLAIDVKAATLRAVGEWLLLHAGHATDQEIEALCNGQWPAGWEGR